MTAWVRLVVEAPRSWDGGERVSEDTEVISYVTPKPTDDMGAVVAAIVAVQPLGTGNHVTVQLSPPEGAWWTPRDPRPKE